MLAEIELSCDGGHGADQERDRAGDAAPERIPFDLAEAKDQERPYRQDHEHDKPDQEINALCVGVFDGKVGRDGPQGQCIEPAVTRCGSRSSPGQRRRSQRSAGGGSERSLKRP
jgi:hypothetical protein